jgi:hypothetical protein
MMRETIGAGIRRDGRWGGSVTSRPLPDDDSIGELSPTQRLVLADVWLGRAASERRVSDAFAVVRDALTTLGARDRAGHRDRYHANVARRRRAQLSGPREESPLHVTQTERASEGAVGAARRA